MDTDAGDALARRKEHVRTVWRQPSASHLQNREKVSRPACGTSWQPEPLTDRPRGQWGQEQLGGRGGGVTGAEF